MIVEIHTFPIKDSERHWTDGPCPCRPERRDFAEVLGESEPRGIEHVSHYAHTEKETQRWQNLFKDEYGDWFVEGSDGELHKVKELRWDFVPDKAEEV